MMSKTATIRTGAINSVGRIVHSGSGTVARCLTHGLAVMLLALPMLSGLSNEAIAQTAGVTISPTTITIDENGGSDTYTVVLNTVPAGDVEIAVSSDTVSAATVEPMVLTFTTEDWSMAQRVTVTGVNDDTDNPGSREAMLSHSISMGDSGNYPADGSVSIDAVTVTVTDDEPTTITVAIDDRFISESGSAEITVTLDRALVEGEQVTYTLSALGNDPDYNLTLKSGAGNTGVSLLTTDPYSVTNPGIRLAGANARIATLELTPVDNDVGDEPLAPIILQGGFPAPSSNLDGGHGLVPFSTRLFIVDDDNGLPEVSVIVSRDSPNNLSVRETESAGIMLAVHAVIVGVWHEDIDVSVTVTETGGYVTAGTGTLTLRIDQGDDGTEAALLTITDDLVDEPDGSVMVMVNAGSGYRVSTTNGSWTTRLIDDDPTLVSITRIGGMGNIDEGGTVAFTVTLGRELVAGEVIDVPLQIAGVDTADWSLTRQPGAANPGVTLHDTSTSSPVVRFAEGSRIATLELTAVADGIAETGGVKELVISLGPDDDTAAGFDLGSRQTNVGGGADPDLSADRFTLMIDDVVTALPVVIIAGGAAVMEGTTATFTVTVTPAQTDTLTVSLNVDDVAGSDFVESGNEGSQMVVVPAGQGTVSYSVVTTADDMDEPNSAVTVLVSRGSGSGYTPGSPAEAMVSVIDGDATTVTLQGDPGDVSESSDKIFTLTLGRGLVRGESLTVPLTLTGSATPGTDYTLALATSILADADDIRIADSGSANPTVTFTGPAAGVGPIVARLSVNTIPDGVGNDDGETVQIGLGMLDASSGTGLGGGAIGTGSLAFSIQDRRPILVLPGTLSVDEESSSTYTVALAAEPTADVTVTISGAGFGVTVDTDPDMPSDQNTLTFTSNDWATAQAVTVSAAADDGNRLDERVALRHTATGASEYTRVTGSIVVTVNDNDALPVITIAGGAAVMEGSGDAATFTLTADPAPTADLTVTVAVAEEAGQGQDFVDAGNEDTGREVTIGTSGTAEYTVAITDDDVDESNGTITVTIEAGSDYTVGDPGTATVMVNDDDVAGVTVTQSEGDTEVAESGGTDSYTVVLTSEPAANVEITVTSGDTDISRVAPNGGAFTASTVLTFTATTWNQAQTVRVQGVDDDVANTSDRTVAIGHEISAPDADSGYPADRDIADVTVTVTDDDTAGLDISETAVRVDEEGSSTYTVALTSEPTADVTVTITGASDPLMVDTGATLTFDDSNWSDVQTVTLTAADDADRDDETFILVHTASGSATEYGSVSEDVTVRVIDNDAVVQTAGVTVSTDSLRISVENGQQAYTVRLNSEPDSDVVITVTSEAPSVFRLGTGRTVLAADASGTITLTFSTGNWSQPQQVTVAGVNDDIDNLNDMRTGTITHVITTGDGGDYDGTLGIDPVSVTVLDEDIPTIEITADSSSVEEGDTATFIISLISIPEQSEKMLTISLMVSENTGGNRNVVPPAAEGAQTVEIPPNTGSVTYTIRTQSDRSSLDGQITVEVVLAPGTDFVNNFLGISYFIIGSSASVDVTDDGSVTADLSISEAAVAVDEEGSSTYTVALTTEPTADVTVTITGASDPLTVDTGSTLTFDDTNWSDVQTVTLTAADDADRDDETFILVHTASGSATEYGSVSEDVTVRVNDDDVAGLDISETAVTVDEEGSSTYTVALTSEPTADVTVTITGASASLTVDPGATLTFDDTNWSDVQTVTLTAADDANMDGETFILVHTASGSAAEYGSVREDVTVRVIDNDSTLPEVTIAGGAAVTEGSGDAATFTLTADPAPTADLTVTVAVAEEAGQDFVDAGTEGAGRSVTIGTSGTAEYTVAITDNDVDESNGTITVTIEAGSDYTVGDPGTATVVVNDDDVAGVTVTQSEGDTEVTESGGIDSYTVVLTSEPAANVEITVTSGDTDISRVAPNGGAFTASTVLTFTATTWNQAQTVRVQGVDDDVANTSDRTVVIGHEISAPDADSGYPADRDIADVTVTVTDDDEAGVMIAQSAGNTVVAELGGMDSYTMVLSSEPAGNIVISVTSGEVTAATVEPMVLTFTTATWNVAQTVTVTGVDDDIGNEGGQRIVTVSHAVTTDDAGSGYPADLSIDAVSVTVTDDDEAGVTIAQTGAGTSVAELGGTDSYTVVLNAEPTGDVVIDVTSGEVTAATVEPTALTFTMTTWNVAQTVTVTGEDDDIDNAGDGRVVSISHAVRAGGSGGYDAVLIAAVSVSVEDDDEASLMFLPDVVRVDEASEQSYEVSLGTQPISNVTVTISGSGGATGLRLDDDELTFTAGNWNEPQEVTVSAAPDDDMDNEVVTLMHRASAGYGAPATGQVEVRVTDDDIALPGVQVSPTQVTVDENGGVSGYDVVLRTRPLGDVEIELSVSGAASAADVGPLSLSFTPTDWDVAQAVRVTGVNDDIDSADRMLDIGHTITTNDGGSYTVALSIDSVSVRVEDDDEAGAHVNPGIVTVNESVGMGSYTVVLTSQPLGNSTVTIGLASRDSTAAIVSPASLSFTSMNWDEAVRVTVTGVNDEVDNAGDVRVLDIVHAVTAGDGVGYRAGATVLPVATVIVEDDGDDASLLLDVDERNADGTLSLIEQGDSRHYRVRLSSQPLSDVTVTITGAGSSLRVDAGGAGNSLTFTTMNWSEVQTVTLTAVDDGNLSGERVTLLHAASGGGYDGVTGELTVLIADNDRMSGVSIDSDALRVDEAGDMAMAFYTVVLDAQPSGDVEIGVSSDMTSAATVNPAVLRFTTANWNLRQRVTVTGEDDDIDNAGDGRMALITHTVRLSDGAGYPVDLTIDDVMVSVMDDDEAGLMFDPERVFIAEEGDSRNYGVRLSSQPTGDVTVTVNDAVGGLSVDTGGMPVNSLTFSRMNWREAQNVMVLAFDDGNEVTETVTLTHTAVGGDYDSVTGGVDVVIADNDRAAGVSVDETVVSVSEGETVIYTVVLDSEPRSDVEIRVTSSDSRIASVSPLTALTFTSDNWNEPQEVRVSGIDDAIDRADRMVSVDHAVSTGDSGGYNAGLSIESVSVTVLDDDERGLVLNRSTLGVVEDGASVAYTVSLSSQPTGDVMVTVNGAVGGLSVDTGGMPVNSLTFSSMNWRVAQNVMVRAFDDGNEVTETVTLTHTAVGGDYDLMMARSLMVRIADDESMMAGVSVSERRVTVEESGGTATYRIHLDSPPMGNVVVNVLSTDMQAAKVEPVSVGFTPLNWGEEQLVTVTGVDDDVDNGAFRTVRIEHRIVAGDGVGYRTGLSIESLEVRVTDDEGRSAGDEEQAQMQAAQAVWLSRFGLTAVEHMLGGLDYRFSSSRRAGLSGNVKGLPNGGAGQALSGEGVSLVRSLGVDGFGHGRAVGVGSGHDGFGAGSVDRLFKLSRSLSLPNMLRGSRFTYTDEGGTSVWGQASYSSYAGSPGEVSVKGDVTTAMLGMDRELGRTLLGLALAYSDGDGDWDDAGSGEFSSKLTSLLPYVRYDVTDRLRFWGAASYGQGELEQTPSRGSVSTHDLEQVSASAGLRGTLMQSALEEGGLTLTLISEATLVRTETDDADDAGVQGMTLDTHRFRMGLEWSWQSAETNGIRFTPELELGVRYDGGDTDTGLGIELGGGISWELPSSGLTIDLRGRHLLEHEDPERDEWGISGSLRFKLRPGSSHGPSLSLSQEYGNTTASSGLDRLLSGSLSDALEEDTSRAGEVSSRWTLKGEWGFALDGGATGVPYAGLSSSGDKRDLTLGWRLSSPGDDLDMKLDVRAMRREKEDGDANHSIGAELKVNW